MAVETYTKSGTKASSSATLNKAIFSVSTDNQDILKRVYLAQLAEMRNAHANVKTRGLVRGGGRKPWRQKGTGRARFGSIRNPIWRGGGIVFGPTGQENYDVNVSKREKATALKQALTLKKKHIKVIETFECKDGKVSKTVALLKKLGTERKTLIVVGDYSDLVRRATNNISNVKAVDAAYLSAKQVLDYDTIVITKESLELLNKRLGGKHE